jgi:negative regulator of flagellin synthesis FlgM
MDISIKKTPTRLDTYIKNIEVHRQQTGTVGQTTTSDDGERDTVVLSAQAKQIQEAGKLLKSMPDIREDMVAQIRQEIETGTYRFDAKKIAAAMIKEAVSDEDI